MRQHARFFALLFFALFFAVSADFNRAQAQAPTPTPVQVGQVIISEFRLRGPVPPPMPAPAEGNAQGQLDEFVELYNNTDSPITVQSLDGSAGWTVAISNGQITGPLFTVPNGTVIPARGHLLGANSLGYSLCDYPSGTGTIGVATPTSAVVGPCASLNGVGGTFQHTTPDRTWDFDVPDGTGLALFATTNGTNFTAAFRLDAAGFTGSPALYKEGGGIPNVVTASLQHTYYRDLSKGTPRDTADNASDFLLVGTAPGIQVSRLGAPGPENLFSPIVNNATITPSLYDPNVSSTSSPNRERNITPEPNADLGTILLRRTITNNTGLPIVRLRFRVVIITTLGTPASECPAPSCADLRALTSQDEVTATPTPTPVVLVRGLELEDDPPEQSAGGGYNSSLSDNKVTLASPLLPGQSINVVFKLGVMRAGPFRFFMNIEAQNSVSHTRFDGPAASGVGTNGGTDFQKRKLVIDTDKSAPAAGAAPASPAAPGASPRNLYVPLFIDLTPTPAAEEVEEKKDEEGKEKKPEEAAPPAEPAPQAPAVPAEAAPKSTPAETPRAPQKKQPAAAKARPVENQ